MPNFLLVASCSQVGGGRAPIETPKRRADMFLNEHGEDRRPPRVEHRTALVKLLVAADGASACGQRPGPLMRALPLLSLHASRSATAHIKSLASTPPMWRHAFAVSFRPTWTWFTAGTGSSRSPWTAKS